MAEKLHFLQEPQVNEPTEYEDPTLNWPEADDGVSPGQEIPDGD